MTFSAYANTGPFTNNSTPPGISATFLNNVESFLDQVVASTVADAHVTADGNGNVTTPGLTLTGSGTGLTVQHNATVSGDLHVSGNLFGTGGTVTAGDKIKLTQGVNLTGGALGLLAGSISRLSIFTGSATSSGNLQAHGLGATPDFCIFQETGTAGDVNTFSWDKNASDGTNVKVWTANATARTYIALAIKL